MLKTWREFEAIFNFAGNLTKSFLLSKSDIDGINTYFFTRPGENEFWNVYMCLKRIKMEGRNMENSFLRATKAFSISK